MVVPQKLKKWFSRYLRNNAHRDDAVFGVTDVEALKTEQVAIINAGDILSQNDYLNLFTMGSRSEDVDVTSTIDTDVAEGTGGFENDNIPSGCTLYGRLMAYLDSGSGETITVKPRVRGANGDVEKIDTVAVTSSAGASFEPVDSGWSDISADVGQTMWVHDRVRGSVSGGTGTLRKYAFLAAWRIE